jgi:integrase
VFDPEQAMSRIGQHTLGHLDCPACDEEKRAIMYGEAFAARLFPEAAQIWLRSRKQISDNTRKHYRDYISSLEAFFAQMRLREIHVGHIVTYQRSRQEAIRMSRRHRAGLAKLGLPADHRLESDGASRINHELSCMGQILQLAGLWDTVKRFYEPLPLPKESAAMALSFEEEQHLFEVARLNKRWQVAFYCALLSRNTTAGPGEIRHLRLGDIELGGEHGSFMHIEEGVKNKFRKRPIPLNQAAERAIVWLLERAEKLGAVEPHHYVLPHRAPHLGAVPDPARPMGSWKRAHWAMCAEAAKKFPRLARLRLYDYRHTAATDLLEDPAISFTTIEHMLGHRIASNTKRKYDHLRNSALRMAADALNRCHTEESSVPRRAPARERAIVKAVVGSA